MRSVASTVQTEMFLASACKWLWWRASCRQGSSSSSSTIVAVDLYSASRSASNALNFLCAAKRWVFSADLKPLVLRAGSRSECGNEFHSIGPATEKARRLVTVGQSKSLTAWDVKCTRKAVHQILRSLILQTPVNCDSEVILNTLWNVQPLSGKLFQMKGAEI